MWKSLKELQISDRFADISLFPSTFSQVAGFPIFGVGQPTEEGFFKVLEKTKVSLPPSNSDPAPADPAPVPAPAEGEAPLSDDPPRAIWFNMRKEPIIYVNGSPCSPR